MGAAEEVRDALEGMIRTAGEGWVRVYESAPEMLRAIVVSDLFANVWVTERQNRVWDYLVKNVPPASLSRLYGVHPHTRQEYMASRPTDVTSTGILTEQGLVWRRENRAGKPE